MNRFALVSIAAFAVSSVAGCASTESASTTTMTSADVAAPATRESTPREAAPVFPGAAPSGDLTCRVSSIQEGNIELYLSWGSDGAKGTLRRRAPSGMITETKVHAERVQGAIVADDVLSTDLVSHAAMVRERKGKRYIRVGDPKQPWLSCQ